MERRKIIIVVLLILTSFLVLALHILTNLMVYDKGWSIMQLFGFVVPINLIYDLSLYTILGLIVGVIVLILLDKK